MVYGAVECEAASLMCETGAGYVTLPTSHTRYSNELIRMREGDGLWCNFTTFKHLL